MARALECPACGHRHRLDTIPAAATFRCEQCGQVLKAPSPVSSQPGAPPPPARSTTTAPVRTGAPAAPAPPPRRTRTEPDDDGATRAAPVRTAAGVSAVVAANAEADPPNGSAPAGGGERRARRSRSVSAAPAPAAAPAAAPRTKVHWYWRLVAWVVAVPLAFVVTAWPAYKFGFIEKDDLLDIFVGTGIGRYVRLGIVTLVWAVVTALLVQLFVEGGRARANRRRRARATGPSATAA
jgi:hypothetical protein